MGLYRKEYFHWLMHRIDADPQEYSQLMETLHETEFYWVIPEDKRRALDGVALREEFVTDFPFHIEGDILDDFFTNYPCSVLEMLVALAIRVDNEYIGALNKEQPEIIFWEMLDNLGLKKYKNRRFCVKNVKNALNNFLKKTRTTPFPSRKNTPKRYEKWEIWAQMTRYLAENY